MPSASKTGALQGSLQFFSSSQRCQLPELPCAHHSTFWTLCCCAGSSCSGSRDVGHCLMRSSLSSQDFRSSLFPPAALLAFLLGFSRGDTSQQCSQWPDDSEWDGAAPPLVKILIFSLILRSPCWRSCAFPMLGAGVCCQPPVLCVSCWGWSCSSVPSSPRVPAWSPLFFFHLSFFLQLSCSSHSCLSNFLAHLGLPYSPFSALTLTLPLKTLFIL